MVSRLFFINLEFYKYEKDIISIGYDGITANSIFTNRRKTNLYLQYRDLLGKYEEKGT